MIKEIIKTVLFSASLARLIRLITILLAASPLCAQQITLSSNTEVSTEGYFVLSWQAQALAGKTETSATRDETFIRQSHSSDFSQSKNYPVSAISALTLSGFENGEYFFQLVSPAGNSNVLQVRVQHHALSKAMAFFMTGLLLFVVLVCSIFYGLRQSKEEHLG